MISLGTLRYIRNGCLVFHVSTLFTCTPEVSLERENQVKLISRPGTAMNPDMLAKLLRQYEKLKDEPNLNQLKPVNTSTTTSPLGTALDIADDLITLFSSQ